MARQLFRAGAPVHVADTPTPQHRPPSLTERHADQTRQWIIAAAADHLEQDGAAPLTNAAIAQRAGVSERTVYRHFATREAMIDALGSAVAERLGTPDVPRTALELLDYPAQLFAAFEARSALTLAALGTEVFSRMRDGPGARRWQAIQDLIQRHRPDLSPDACRMAAANIRYLLSASTWRYYRHQFGFDEAQTEQCVRQAIALQLQGLGLIAVPDRPVRGARSHRASGPA